MAVWSSWWQTDEAHLPKTGIDLGQGRMLPPEDVLEGHFRRVQAQPRAAARPAQTVAVQVRPNLTAAIAVMAPALAPLAAVAEGVSSAVPPVQPTPEFRAHLQQALERTHRQHAAQRCLGARPAPRRAAAPGHGAWLGWMLALAGGLVLLWLWRRRAAAA